MNCGCEHGIKCTKVAACAVDDMISEAVFQAESKWEDKHLAFVARVKALAEGMEHDEGCPAAWDECQHTDEDWGLCRLTEDEHVNESHSYKQGGCEPSVCIRGELLAVCGEVK